MIAGRLCKVLFEDCVGYEELVWKNLEKDISEQFIEKGFHIIKSIYQGGDNPHVFVLYIQEFKFKIDEHFLNKGYVDGGELFVGRLEDLIKFKNQKYLSRPTIRQHEGLGPIGTNFSDHQREALDFLFSNIDLDKIDHKNTCEICQQNQKEREEYQNLKTRAVYTKTQQYPIISV